MDVTSWSKCDKAGRRRSDFLFPHRPKHPQWVLVLVLLVSTVDCYQDWNAPLNRIYRGEEVGEVGRKLLGGEMRELGTMKHCDRPQSALR